MDINELLQQGYRAQEEAALLFTAKSDEAAHCLNRIAVEKIFKAFHREIKGDVLVRLLYAFRSLAVSSFATKRTEEGVLALGTGLSYAAVGLKTWSDAPPLLEEYAVLQALEKTVRGRLTVLIVEDVTDDWQWPFDD